MTAHRTARQLLVDMFDEMVMKKDITALPRYYRPDFVLETNGRTQSYDTFVEGHRNISSTSIRYTVCYDDDAWAESDDRVAARVWITMQRPNEPSMTVEMMLLATVRNGKFHRMWELTRPAVHNKRLSNTASEHMRSDGLHVAQQQSRALATLPVIDHQLVRRA
jgi:hypothetical protein